MSLESFKDECFKKTTIINDQRGKLIKRFEQLKIEQTQYGDRYRPVFGYGFLSGNTTHCPHCEKQVSRLPVPNDGYGSKYIYSCTCGWEYAWG